MPANKQQFDPDREMHSHVDSRIYSVFTFKLHAMYDYTVKESLPKNTGHNTLEKTFSELTFASATGSSKSETNMFF